MNDYIRRAEMALDREHKSNKAKHVKTKAVNIGVAVAVVLVIVAAALLAPRLIRLIPKPGFLKTNDELVANFTSLKPGLSCDDVVELLGQPTKKEGQEARKWMVSVMADPGNICSLSVPAAFEKQGKSGQDTEWSYGPYPGKIHGQKSVGGSVVLVLAFSKGTLIDAKKLAVHSSVADSALVPPSKKK